MPEEIIARVVARVGRTHPFDKLEASKTAFVVIDHAKLLREFYWGDVPLVARRSWAKCCSYILI